MSGQNNISKVKPDKTQINLTAVNSSAANSGKSFSSANGAMFIQSNSNSTAGTRGVGGNAPNLNDPPKVHLTALSPNKASGTMTRQQILAMALSN
jgi:hypothetical protein